MSMISMTARRRIEAQGFVGLDDNSLSQINYWLRLAPANCMIWTAMGTALASPAIRKDNGKFKRRIMTKDINPLS
jgi:hypothetical protein